MVDLGHVHSRPGHPHHPASNGTSRSQRQERRAAARKQAAEEAEKSHAKVDKVSEPVEVEKAAGKVNSSEKVAVTKDVTDEFCSNTEYSESESKEIYSFKSDIAEENKVNLLLCHSQFKKKKLRLSSFFVEVVFIFFLFFFEVVFIFFRSSSFFYIFIFRSSSF